MKHLKHLKDTLATCMYMQHPDLLLQHLDENTCNIRLKQMKHLEHTLETYEYSHYNMCNIPIYFCNIDIQHLKHTLATCAFNVPSTCCFDERRLINTKLDAMEWRVRRRGGDANGRTTASLGEWLSDHRRVVIGRAGASPAAEETVLPTASVPR